jgi:hypothetical protein
MSEEKNETVQDEANKPAPETTTEDTKPEGDESDEGKAGDQGE